MRFSCDLEDCSATFVRPWRLEAHKRATHLDERPLVCKFEGCSKAYTTTSHLKRHLKLHNQTQHKCPYDTCNNVFKTEATLKKHIDQAHLKKKKKQYKCSYCDEEFNKHNWLQRHIFKHTGDYPYKCTIESCGKGFLLPTKLKRHMRSIHEGYKCDKSDCNQTFPKWSLLVSHKKESHPTLHKCNTCNKTFSRLNNLKAHLDVHTTSVKRQVYPCTEPNCSRFYFANRNLQWHIKTYHLHRPFACDRTHCERAFKTQKLLDDHLLRHDGKKRQIKAKPRLAAVLAGETTEEIDNPNCDSDHVNTTSSAKD